MFSGPITLLILVVFISSAAALNQSITVSPTATRIQTTSALPTLTTETSTSVAVTPSATNTVSMGGGATTTPGGGGGGGGVSPTTTQPTGSSSSVVVNTKPGPHVKLSLNVTTNCSGGHLLTLNISLQVDIKAAYDKAGFKIKSVITASIGCESTLTIVLDLSFYSGNPTGKTIKGVFDDAVKDGAIANLTTDNTVATFTFVGVIITYKPKDGQCEKVCCDGAGGEMTVVPRCTPEEKCEGIVLPAEKKEDGHCPGEAKGTCTTKCQDDSGGIHNSPSFAPVVLMAIASFIKQAFY